MADETESKREVKPRAQLTSTDGLDWSEPSKMRQMNAGWILLWLAVPFLACVLYGVMSG